MALSAKTVHVIWQGRDGAVWYARSADFGATWAEVIDLHDGGSTSDMVMLAPHPAGDVVVGWYDGRLGEAEHSPVGLPLAIRASADDGRSWGRSRISETSFPGWFCACWEIEPRIVGDELVVALRGAYRAMRDLIVVRGPIRQPGAPWIAEGGRSPSSAGSCLAAPCRGRVSR